MPQAVAELLITAGTFILTGCVKAIATKIIPIIRMKIVSKAKIVLLFIATGLPLKHESEDDNSGTDCKKNYACFRSSGLR